MAFLELERKLPADDSVAINTNDTLVFDSIISSEGLGSQIDYDMDTGIITFIEPGYYYIDWLVAPQTGLTTDGCNWAVQTSISKLSYIGSSNIKVTETIGFAIIQAAAGETARLVNVSDGALFLSKTIQPKASLKVYNVKEINENNIEKAAKH